MFQCREAIVDRSRFFVFGEFADGVRKFAIVIRFHRVERKRHHDCIADERFEVDLIAFNGIGVFVFSAFVDEELLDVD